MPNDSPNDPKEELAKFIPYLEDFSIECNKGSLLLADVSKGVPLVQPQIDGKEPSTRAVGVHTWEKTIEQAKRNSDEMVTAYKLKNKRGVASEKRVFDRKMQELNNAFSGASLKFKYEKVASGKASGKARQSLKQLILSVGAMLIEEGVGRNLPKNLLRDPRLMAGLTLLGIENLSLRHAQDTLKEFKKTRGTGA